MNSRFFGILAALGAAAFAACAEDPTATLRGGPSSISINPNPLVVTQGTTDTIEVVVRDAQLNGLPVPLTVSGASAAITVTPETTTPDPTGVHRRYVVRGVSAAATSVNASAGGLSRSGTVAVLPPLFHGTLNPASPQVGDVLTFTTAAPLAFGSADVDFGDGIRGWITGQNATSLTVIVPQADVTQPSALTIEDLIVTGVPGLTVAVPTAALNIVNPYDPNDAPGPAATLTFPVTFYDGFKTDEADNFYTFTLDAPTTVTFLLEWQTDADIDLYVCDLTCTLDAHYIGGATRFAAATGANPETATMTLPAGTHNLYVNVFDEADDPAHVYRVTITIP